MEDISSIFTKFVLGMVVLFVIGYASILCLSHMSLRTKVKDDISTCTYIKVADVADHK